jgi:hypothetical protein
LPTNTHGYIITIVTKKASSQTRAWTLTGDITIRFGNARAAISAYHQQRTQHHNMNTQAERVLI